MPAQGGDGKTVQGGPLWLPMIWHRRMSNAIAALRIHDINLVVRLSYLRQESKRIMRADLSTVAPG